VKKKILVLITLFTFPLLTINAEIDWNKIFNETYEYESIPELYDSTIVSDDTDGSKFKAGLDIDDNENVDGINGIAGEKITVKGDSEYGLFAGLDVKVNSNIEKELFAAGNEIEINAQIGRDAYIAGSEVEISGSIGKNAYIAAESIEFDNVTINGNVKIIASNIEFGDNVTIYGEIKYNDNAIITGLDTLNNQNINTYHLNDLTNETTFVDTLLNTLLSLVGLVLVAYVINYLCPRIYKNLEKEIVFKDLAIDSLIGLVMLIVVPIISIMIMITGIGTPLSLIVLALYGILCYISKLTILSIIGNNLYTILLKKKDNPYISILIGCTLYYLLTLIPYLSGIISFLVLIIGFGYIKSILCRKK